MTSRISATALSLLAVAGGAVAELPEGADDYVKHLEFNSYTAQAGEKVITATHEENLNMVLKAYKGGVLLQTWYSTSDWDIKDDDLGEMVNTLNTNATVARFYIDDEDDTMVEAWYPGDYDRKRFSVFLDAWHEDTAGQYTVVATYIKQ